MGMTTGKARQLDLTLAGNESANGLHVAGRRYCIAHPTAQSPTHSQTCVKGQVELDHQAKTLQCP